MTVGSKSILQYFSGEKTFQWKYSVEPSDLVHLRKRVGRE